MTNRVLYAFTTTKYTMYVINRMLFILLQSKQDQSVYYVYV